MIAYLLHRFGDRVRVHVPEAREDPDLLRSLGERLMASDRIMSYDANPTTGSFVVVSEEPWTESRIAELARLSGLSLRERSDYDPTVAVSRIGAAELWNLGAASFLGLAMMQARRGKFFPAGLTLLFQGWDLIRTSRGPTPMLAHED